MAIVGCALPAGASGAREPLFERDVVTPARPPPTYAPGRLLVTYRDGGPDERRAPRRRRPPRAPHRPAPHGHRQRRPRLRARARSPACAATRASGPPPATSSSRSSRATPRASATSSARSPTTRASTTSGTSRTTPRPCSRPARSPSSGRTSLPRSPGGSRSANPATRIAIVDTGIDAAHEDLAGRVVDAATLEGNADGEDYVGHGTAVAGVAAAIPNNGQGIAGVAFNASLMNIKVAQRLRATTAPPAASITAGIVYAVDNGARVINVSAGSESPCPPMENAVELRVEQRPAGRRRQPATRATRRPIYPAAYSERPVGRGHRQRRPARGLLLVRLVGAAGRAGRGDRHDRPGPDTSSPTARRSPRRSSPAYAALIWPTVRDADRDGFRSDDLVERLVRYADPIAGTGTDWQAGRVNACRAAAAGAALVPAGAGRLDARADGRSPPCPAGPGRRAPRGPHDPAPRLRQHGSPAGAATRRAASGGAARACAARCHGVRERFAVQRHRHHPAAGDGMGRRFLDATVKVKRRRV